MLDIEFDDVVILRGPRSGSRKNATEVVWDPVLDSTNELVRIECKLMRRQSKSFSTQASEEVADATLLFKVDGPKDVTREQLVVDEFGQAYKVLGVYLEREKYGEDIYKKLTLKLTDKTFPPAGVDA